MGVGCGGNTVQIVTNGDDFSAGGSCFKIGADVNFGSCTALFILLVVVVCLALLQLLLMPKPPPFGSTSSRNTTAAQLSCPAQASFGNHKANYDNIANANNVVFIGLCANGGQVALPAQLARVIPDDIDFRRKRASGTRSNRDKAHVRFNHLQASQETSA